MCNSIFNFVDLVRKHDKIIFVLSHKVFFIFQRLVFCRHVAEHYWAAYMWRLRRRDAGASRSNPTTIRSS